MGTLLTFLAVGLVTLIAAGVVISVVGAILGLTFGLAQFLLFKIAPVMFIGWLALKIFDKVRGKRQISASDQRWLDGG
ncbi:MAG: hypothetical protein MUO50_17570 [Longimicrobiales bacterium]|nr:hypothetical protein [Longimicrobiales bacterium]